MKIRQIGFFLIAVLLVGVVVPSANASSKIYKPDKKVLGRSDNAVVFKILAPDGKPVVNRSIARGIAHGLLPFVTDWRGIAVDEYAMDNEDRYDAIFGVSNVGYARVSIPREKLFRKDPIVVRLQGGTFVAGKVISKTTYRPLGGVVLFPIRNVLDEEDKWSDWNNFYQDDNFAYERTEYDPFTAVSHDGDGTFSLGPLPAGQYYLQYVDWSNRNPITITSKERNINVTIEEDIACGSEFHGRLLKRGTKTPLAFRNATIYLLYDISYADTIGMTPVAGVYRPIRRYVRTDKDGNFTLYPFDWRNYRVSISCDGYYTKGKLTESSRPSHMEFQMEKRHLKNKHQEGKA